VVVVLGPAADGDDRPRPERSALGERRAKSRMRPRPPGRGPPAVRRSGTRLRRADRRSPRTDRARSASSRSPTRRLEQASSPALCRSDRKIPCRDRAGSRRRVAAGRWAGRRGVSGRSRRTVMAEVVVARLSRPLHTARFVFGCVRAVFGQVVSPGVENRRNACKSKADARIRTADPFITSVDQGGQPVPTSPSRPSEQAKTTDPEGQRGAQGRLAVFGWCSDVPNSLNQRAQELQLVV
jgi:hypothetical protein